MAFALVILNQNNCTVVEHVSNYSDDTVHVEEWAEFGLKQCEYRKSHHLLSEIKEFHPDWTVHCKEFDVTDVIPL